MRVIAAWWRKNRQAAPTLFEEELDDAIKKIQSRPQLGVVHDIIGGETFRRILLPKTKQHLFYVVDEANAMLVVHTIWGARRGS